MVVIFSHIVTTNIKMMGICCPSRLLSRFSTTIDGIIMLISGLGPTLGAIYRGVKIRSCILKNNRKIKVCGYFIKECEQE
jgi:hypothetical protein